MDTGTHLLLLILESFTSKNNPFTLPQYVRKNYIKYDNVGNGSGGGAPGKFLGKSMMVLGWGEMLFSARK